MRKFYYNVSKVRFTRFSWLFRHLVLFSSSYPCRGAIFHRANYSTGVALALDFCSETWKLLATLDFHRSRDSQICFDATDDIVKHRKYRVYTYCAMRESAGSAARRRRRFDLVRDASTADIILDKRVRSHGKRCREGTRSASVWNERGARSFVHCTRIGIDIPRRCRNHEVTINSSRVRNYVTAFLWCSLDWWCNRIEWVRTTFEQDKCFSRFERGSGARYKRHAATVNEFNN